MGADGWITVQRVREGEYLIADDRSAPQFVVREPSLILFAGGYDLSGTGKSQGVHMLDFDPGPGPRPHPPIAAWIQTGSAQLVMLETGDAVIVVPRKWYEEWHGRHTQEVPPRNAVFDKLVPGRWLVISYQISGTDHDGDSYRYRPPPGVVMGEEIDWEAWT